MATQIELRDQARELLEQAIGMWSDEGVTEATINKQRVGMARDILYCTDAQRKALFAAIDPILRPSQPKPAPEPTPPAPRVRGAMVVTAGNISPLVLQHANVQRVAVELTGPNLTEVNRAAWLNTFEMGGLFISRGPDAENEAVHVSTIVKDNPFLKFMVIDTECHKVGMGGERIWTENLYRELRERLPKPFPIFNVTFGVDAHLDDAVNQTALRTYGIIPTWETYNENGYTLGLTMIRDRAIAGGQNPANLVLGDKSLRSDIPELRGMAQVGDVWLWAPDNGQAQEDLASGLVIP